MLSPFMTVTVLVVLWLIVVVPMVVRRSDDRRQDRSVARFGRGMRALGRRTLAGDLGADPQAAEVYVPRGQGRARAPLADPDRRPVPAAQEALMYPPDRTDLSAARTRMLTRRRRSLGTLAGGTVLFALLGLIAGGVWWVLAALFAAGFVGYLWFLHNQALNDRARRESRQQRAAARRPAGYDATADDAHWQAGQFEQHDERVVRIDDDDIELQSMDTIDLTGLYSEDAAPSTAVRRAS